MQLLIFSQYFWPEGFSINELAFSLVRKGISVEVLTGQPNYPKGQIFLGYHAWSCGNDSYCDLPIVRIPILPRSKGALCLAFNYCSFVLSGAIVSPWLLRKKKYDAILVYAPSPILQAIPAIFLGWLKGCPVVLWVQDLWPESLSATGYIHHPALLNLIQSLVAWIYRHVTILLVPSHAFISSVEKLASGTPVLYYPNSVDVRFAKPSQDEVISLLGLNDQFSVLFAGNIGKAQAVKVIVDTAVLLKDHRNINFIVIGEGVDREWMMGEVKARKLSNLHLPGYFSVDKMPGILQRASALLVTLADQPIFSMTVPNKIQAYLASGRPVIACLNGEGARIVVEAGAGLAAPAENAQALASVIIELSRMPSSELDRMGELGKKYYEKYFNHEKLVGQLIAHMQLAIKLRKT